MYIGVHDDEGNYRGRQGCEYESEPWSGLSYALHHEGRGDCILCTDGDDDIMGGILFDTVDDAADEWNDGHIVEESNGQKVLVDLPNGYKLVAERSSDPMYEKEIYIGLLNKDGVWCQDLAVVGELRDGVFGVFVYSDCNDEDYTHEFTIGMFQEESK